MARPDVVKTAGMAFGSRRVRFGLTTSAFSSLGGFAVGIAVARNEPIGVVGEFAIAGASYALASGAVRAGFAETALVLDHSEADVQRGARRVSTVGLAAAVLLAAVGLAMSSAYILVAAVALHGLCVYEYIKTMSLARFRAQTALRMEALWFLVSVPVAGAAVLGWTSPVVAYAVWALAGALIGYGSALMGRFRTLPTVRGEGVSWRLSGTYVADFFIGSGSSQIAVNVLSATAGTGVAGALRAGGTLFGPVGLVLGPARALMIRRFAVLPRGSGAWQRGASMAAVLIVPLLPLLLFVGFFPDALGRAVLGESWEYAAPVLPWLALEAVFSVASAVAFAGHKSLLIARQTLAVRTVLAIARVGGLVVGGILGREVGAAIAMAAVSGLGCVVWWAAYVHGLKNSPSVEKVSRG